MLEKRITPMRICFISHGSGRGGAEEVLLETVECLLEQKVECRVMIPGTGALEGDLRDLGVPYWTLPYWPWMGNGSLLRSAEMVMRNVILSIPAIVKLRKWNPDIIYSNSMTMAFGVILAAVLRRPHVWHLHEFGCEDHGLRFDLGATFSYQVINSASACIAASQAVAEAFARHIDPEKLQVVYPSVHRFKDKEHLKADEPVPPKSHKMRCVIVGAVSEGKRQEDAIVALGELRRMGLDVELLIIGPANPGYRDRLRMLLAKGGLADRVLLLGPVWDPRPFVDSADVVLMCSRCEAFGRVTIEGMLSGKPVVAANSGANPELIQDGVNGLLYNMGDAKALARKAAWLYDHPVVARQIGEDAKVWAERIFTKQRYADELISILNDCVSHEHACRPAKQKPMCQARIQK